MNEDRVMGFLEFKLTQEMHYKDTYKKKKKLKYEYSKYLKTHNISGYYFDGKTGITIYEKKR